jgi:hypothetical protein
MQNSWFSQFLQMLREHLHVEVIRVAIFCRNVWFFLRHFQRNREYRQGIGEVVAGMPLPPAGLISKVTGIPDIA